MLLEIFQYAASLPSTPPRFRRHLGGAVGLWSRGRRQARAWADHTARMHLLIERTLTTLTGRGTVVVLGSGPLFDVPLDALAENFQKVLLVDQAHLATTRKRARDFGNVEFVWRGLSVADEPAPLGFLHDIADLDWVISVNLLSQLGVGANYGDERRVIDAHLAGLLEVPCPVTLATDREYRVINRIDEVIEKLDLLYGRTLPEADEQWLWTVAPFGEESRGSRRVHRVAFYPDLKAADIKLT